MNDTPELIQAVQDWYARRYDVKLDADQIMSVSGSQEGIAHVAFPFAGSGDLVLAPDPGYPIFTFGPMMTGAEQVYIRSTQRRSRYRDFADIPDEVADRAKMIVVSYPNDGLIEKGYELAYPSTTNQVFAVLDKDQIFELTTEAAFEFTKNWDATHDVVRFVTSWATKAEDVDAMLALL